jgi:peroxin-5
LSALVVQASRHFPAFGRLASPTLHTHNLNMADCSATGTALDRVFHSAVSGLAQQSDNGASRHAMKLLGSFVGGTAATADIVGAGVMPSGPIETLHTGGGMMPPNTQVAATANISHPANLHMRNHHMHQGGAHLMHMPPQQMHQHMMNQQMMQSQMMMQNQMQYQMQMQQMQMAAMVEHQKAQQRLSAKQSAHSDIEQSVQADQVLEEAVEDDVVTVDEEVDQLHHEGITDHASIERLAQAWRHAEAEYAAEFDDEYDVSNMGGLYDNVHVSEPCQGFSGRARLNVDPEYEFSPQSQTYGCITTPSTDIAPQELNYPDNLYERGLEHFNAGEIAPAILCFESTLRNIDPEHADAWRMLGKCHTENDADQKAIICWLKSLERDPYSSETLLALVVAYVNELDWEKAVETLKQWVGNHPLYAGMDNLKSEEDLYGSSDIDGELEGGTRGLDHSTLVEMRDVERLLLSALDYNKDDDAAADVYEALGVVYNVSRDYDAAVDSFKRALLVRPDDYQLRNKLGATLANSNRSDEALPEYHAALKLKPKYTRGWLNMAISHSNLRDYSQAARCYLQTLSLNPEAKHVWSYLRIALTCDEKWDLLPLAASQNLSAFHEHFDFVEY